MLGRYAAIASSKFLHQPTNDAPRMMNIPCNRFLAVAAALFAAFQGGDCQSATRAARTDPLVFANDVVHSLALAHTGAVPADTLGAGSVVSMGAAIMYALKRQQSALEQAIAVIQPYTHDRDSTIAVAGETLMLGFTGLHLWADSTATQLRQQLDQPPATGAGAQAEQLASLMDLRHRAALTLVMGTSAVALCLVSFANEPTTAGSSKGHLAMTASEKVQLLSAIKQLFGSALQPKNGQYGSDYSAAAVALRDFLRQSWRTRR